MTTRTTRTSFSCILHLFLFIILVSGCIAAAALGSDEMIVPERKIAKRRMRGRLRGTTNWRKLGSSIKPTKVLAKRATAASGYNDTTLATRVVVLRTTPTLRGADQRRKVEATNATKDYS